MWVEDSWLSSVRRYSAHWHYDDNVSGAISIVAKFPSLLSAEMVKSSFNERNTMAAPLFLRYRTKDNTGSYPAAFQSVLGVRCSRACRLGQAIVVSKEFHEVSAWGGPFGFTYVDGTKDTLQGASFAC